MSGNGIEHELVVQEPDPEDDPDAVRDAVIDPEADGNPVGNPVGDAIGNPVGDPVVVGEPEQLTVWRRRRRRAWPARDGMGS